MILIADSGSTKTHWTVIDQTLLHKTVFTKGINPFYQHEQEIADELIQFLFPELSDFDIEKVYFYGAGCAFDEKKLMVARAINSVSPHVEVEVESDLLGAARSLFGTGEGIACILGTGSNSCLYNGKEIAQHVSPLGYVLGDEGSGAVLGKMLVGDVLKNQLSAELQVKFMEQYNLTPEQILDNVYKKPFPNRFLAGLSVFLYENISYPELKNIVYTSFDTFFKRNVMQFPLDNKQIGFVGTVAFQYKDILAEVGATYGLSGFTINQHPMEGLVGFHMEC